MNIFLCHNSRTYVSRAAFCTCKTFWLKLTLKSIFCLKDMLSLLPFLHFMTDIFILELIIES